MGRRSATENPNIDIHPSDAIMRKNGPKAGPNDMMKTEHNDRASFVRKVLCFFSFQIFITMIMSILPVASDSIRSKVRQYFWIGFIAAFVGLIIGCVIFGAKSCAKRYPVNLFILFLFTACISCLVMVIVAVSEPIVVLIATVMVLTVSLSLVLYAWISKDFTPCIALIIAISAESTIFVIFAVINTELIGGIVGAYIISLFFILLIIYDITLIAGGRYDELDYDDYVIGSMLLYIDVLGFFMFVIYCLKN
jgi:FtsH-binding integral membrane protein